MRTLTQSVNNAFVYKTFPGDVKNAQVSPIFNEKDYIIKDNYLSVNILSVLSNVFETMAAEQLSACFEEIFNNIIIITSLFTNFILQ